jgi:hypothetical protein
MDANTKELFDDLYDALHNYADIDRHGGPNRAMAGLQILDEIRSRYEAECQAHEATVKSFSQDLIERGGP